MARRDRRNSVQEIPPFIDVWGPPTYANPYTQNRPNPALVPVTVPPGTNSRSALSVPTGNWPAIKMLNLTTNKDACKGAALTLTYTGRATG